MNPQRSDPRVGGDELYARKRMAPPSLGLRPREAAKALGLGQRKLWAMTQPRGPIPCIRLGSAVVYPTALLQAWLAEQAGKAVQL